MHNILRLSITAAIVLVNLCEVASHAVAAAPLSDAQTVAVRRLLEHVFGVRSPPPAAPPGAAVRPPPHMLDLYERYTRAKRNVREIVRSILPQTVRSTFGTAKTEMLFFNVSTFGASEEVTSAQLHLRRRRSARHSGLHLTPRSRLLAPPARVRLYSIRSGSGRRGRLKMRSLASIPVAQSTRGGWTSLDVSSAVRELLMDSPSAYNLSLAIRFSAPRGNTVRPLHFLDTRNETAAATFLVIFSRPEPDNDIEASPVEPPPPIGATLADLLHTPPNPSLVPGQNKHRHHVRQHRVKPRLHLAAGPKAAARQKHRFKIEVMSANVSDARGYIYAGSNDSMRDGGDRRERSIENNELPVEFGGSDGSAGDGGGEMAPVEGTISMYDTIPFPTERPVKIRSRAHPRKHHKLNNLPESWFNWNQDNVTTTEASSAPGGRCRRKRLVLDLALIGWSTWIISPKSLAAHFCTGTCPFPLAKEMAAHRDEVPEPPCCVPDTLSPITLLYTDATGNIVLSNYPAMTVETCACR